MRHSKKWLFTILTTLITCLSVNHDLRAEIIGKIDAGPAFVHIDILKNKKTIKRMNLCALRADGFVLPFEGKGWTVKPLVLYGNGGSKNRGEIFTGGLGVGHCIPYQDWVFTPLVGANYTYLRTTVDIPALAPVLGQSRFKEIFHSISPYLGLEIVYSIRCDLRVCGVVQYAWSRTHTLIEKDILDDKSNTSGPCYSAMIEYDLNDHWSVNLGAGYNMTMSQEKNGIRGYGAKAGLAYWF